jgi:hypothetical protein
MPFRLFPPIDPAKIGPMAKKLQQITVMHEGRPVRLIGYLERSAEPDKPDTFQVLTMYEKRALDRRVQDGREAWERLKAANLENFNDWVTVAEALFIGQRACMAEAGKDRPEGGAYVRLFAEWLKKNGFADLDQGARTRALTVLQHLPDIMKWRMSLEPVERIRHNHPQSVLRAWKKWQARQLNPQTAS